MVRFPLALAAASAAVVLALTGCGRSEPAAPAAPATSATAAAPAAAVPVPATPITPMPGQMPGGAAIPQVAADADRLAWQVPTHWQPGPASPMRLGSYVIPGANGADAQVAITAFPGDVGGDLANINRWRMQTGLAELPSAEGVGTPVDIAGLPGRWLHLQGTNGSMLVAWVRVGQGSWFFRVTGPSGTVNAEAAAFPQFLAGITRATPGTAAPAQSGY
jgi:hypothetical protein